MARGLGWAAACSRCQAGFAAQRLEPGTGATRAPCGSAVQNGTSHPASEDLSVTVECLRCITAFSHQSACTAHLRGPRHAPPRPPASKFQEARVTPPVQCDACWTPRRPGWINHTQRPRGPTKEPRDRERHTQTSQTTGQESPRSVLLHSSFLRANVGDTFNPQHENLTKPGVKTSDSSETALMLLTTLRKLYWTHDSIFPPIPVLAFLKLNN